MKIIFALAAVALAIPLSSAGIAIHDATTPELRTIPNDTIGSKYAALPPRAENDVLALQAASADASYPAAAAGAADEAFVDSVIAGAMSDRSKVDEILLRRLRMDLSPCFFETESEKELSQCLRTALEQYKSPEELTNRETRRIMWRGRQYYHTD
jgi:hypothetical protein